MISQLLNIASAFDIEGNICSIESLGEGFINDTLTIRTEGNAPDYILQRKNRHVFSDIPSMMENIAKVTTHIKRNIENNGGDPMRETLTIIPTKEGKLYHTDEQGEYWAVSLLIPDAVTYQRVDSPALARKGGEGIGKFQAQLDDFTEPLAETIKGFHNIRWRFQQWDNALAADMAGRRHSLAREIDWIEARRDEMIHFWERVESGHIPTRVTHNDTKISNILFDRHGEALSVIDLDTVMNSTSLNDVGDAIRSYTNTGEEDDRNTANVSMDMDMFCAYTEGFLSRRGSRLVRSEIENLAFSAKYITYEQVLRFLMDYIDGDKYYRTKYDGHNLVRTHAQHRLLCSMEQQYSAMCDTVDMIAHKQLRTV